MADETPNPLTSHLLNMVQGRQQTELAKLSLLSSVAAKLDAQLEQLDNIARALGELVERAREK